MFYEIKLFPPFTFKFIRDRNMFLRTNFNTGQKYNTQLQIPPTDKPIKSEDSQDMLQKEKSQRMRDKSKHIYSKKEMQKKIVYFCTILLFSYQDPL